MTFRRKLLEHSASILFVLLVFALLVVVLRGEEEHRLTIAAREDLIFKGLEFLDLGNPLHRALFNDTYRIFHPERPSESDWMLQAVESHHQKLFTDRLYKTGAGNRTLNWSTLTELGPMYAEFIAVYVIVMALTYYGAHTLAIYRFIRQKQGHPAFLEQLAIDFRSFRASSDKGRILRRLMSSVIRAAATGLLSLILFAPAYVIAYSFKTRFDTESVFFMILLGVISNGLLITYANKFFTFLVTESRKGYVETAIVKNLNASYHWNRPDGIAFKSVLGYKKGFIHHVFRHIYLNARFQYIPTVKEHASFLITGLVIIEMALNIQHHLCYELLQDILYKQYDIVITILLGIFLVVKGTEIIVDGWFIHESRKYENSPT